MDTEKDFLKKDLGKAETKEEIEKLIDDAETMGHEDIVEMAKEKLAAVLAKAKVAETTPPAQVSQVESMGGSVDEVAKRTEGVDAEIDAVKAETEQKIAEVKGEGVSKKLRIDDLEKQFGGQKSNKSTETQAEAEKKTEEVKLEATNPASVEVGQEREKVLEEQLKKAIALIDQLAETESEYNNIRTKNPNGLPPDSMKRIKDITEVQINLKREIQRAKAEYGAVLAGLSPEEQVKQNIAVKDFSRIEDYMDKKLGYHVFFGVGEETAGQGEKAAKEVSSVEEKPESVDKTLEQAEINEINSDIGVEELYISQAQEVIQRANYTIARNKEAQVDLSDQLGAMVSKSKTGFGFDFIDKPKQFGKYQMAGPAHGMIGGEIGDEPMTLGEALEKGIKNYEEVVKTKEKEIAEREEKIKNLKDKLEGTNPVPIVVAEEVSKLEEVAKDKESSAEAKEFLKYYIKAGDIDEANMAALQQRYIGDSNSNKTFFKNSARIFREVELREAERAVEDVKEGLKGLRGEEIKQAYNFGGKKNNTLPDKIKQLTEEDRNELIELYVTKLSNGEKRLGKFLAFQKKLDDYAA